MRLRPLPRKEWNLSEKSVHILLKRIKPKTGICDFCKKEGKTHYARIHECDHQPSAEHYLELCPGCHVRYDRGKIELMP